jgi:cyclase
MLKVRLIPALLLKNGRMVKPIRFGKNGERDVGFPATTARIYDSQDADELIFLDIEATKKGRGFMLETLGNVSKNCFVPITAGGGIKSLDDIRNLLKAGADKVSINSYAVLKPEFIKKASRRFGRQCIVVSVDVKKYSAGNYRVFTERGKKDTGLDMIEWIKKVSTLGAGEILLTSIDHEGTMKGYDLTAVKMVAEAVNIPVIANGGAGNRKDCVLVIKAGASAAAASSLFHFSDSNLTQVKSFMYNAGVPIRPI